MTSRAIYFSANMTTLLEWLNHFINFQTQHKILTNFLLTLTIGFLAVTIRRYLLSAVPDGINITERRRKVVSIRNSVAGLAIFLIVLVWYRVKNVHGLSFGHYGRHCAGNKRGHHGRHRRYDSHHLEAIPNR